VGFHLELGKWTCNWKRDSGFKESNWWEGIKYTKLPTTPTSYTLQSGPILETKFGAPYAAWEIESVKLIGNKHTFGEPNWW
jgi:hypothetical protein